ncbi:hypothetical protein BDN71DRAFT_1504383 [Pleurotus eryngii]|uniref:Uncharacterized protein n=1 Tax=Pleurotus eryngii TaxID=5323 RepID=A0A9P6DAX5_PLEER|nr:hypothetical protein BDN71DRAFT_1504383 [Pleurotus eryngii]
MSTTQNANANTDTNTNANANEARALPLLATPGQIAAAGYPPVPTPARKERKKGEDEVMDEPGTPPSSPKGTALPPQTPSNHNKRVRRAAMKASTTTSGEHATHVHVDKGSPQPANPNPTTMPAPSPNGGRDVDTAHATPPPGPHFETLSPEASTLPSAAAVTLLLGAPASAQPAPVAYALPSPATGPATTGPLPQDPLVAPPASPGGNMTPTPASTNHLQAATGPAMLAALPPTIAPRLQGVTKDNLFKNMNCLMLAQWEAIQGTKVIILPYDPGYAPD